MFGRLGGAARGAGAAVMKQRGLPLVVTRPSVRETIPKYARDYAPPVIVIEFNDWTDPGPALPFEQIPPEIRLPGEPGYVELDRYMRRVSGKGGAG
jgi:hypothetical protein